MEVIYTEKVKISVVTIAKNEKELENLVNALKLQEYQGFEFVSSTTGSIPEAWNDAISKARGEFIVLTESDAIPLNNQWLNEIIHNTQKNTIIKGVEIQPTPLDLCNLVCDANILKKHKFDENFKTCEDTELFARLRKNGVNIQFAREFPVIHQAGKKKGWRRTISRSLLKGLYFMKIMYIHGKDNFSHASMMSFKTYEHPIRRRLRIIMENILLLLGLVVGSVAYLPILLQKRM